MKYKILCFVRNKGVNIYFYDTDFDDDNINLAHSYKDIVCEGDRIIQYFCYKTQNFANKYNYIGYLKNNEHVICCSKVNGKYYYYENGDIK